MSKPVSAFEFKVPQALSLRAIFDRSTETWWIELPATYVRMANLNPSRNRPGLAYFDDGQREHAEQAIYLECRLQELGVSEFSYTYYTTQSFDEWLNSDKWPSGLRKKRGE